MIFTIESGYRWNLGGDHSNDTVIVDDFYSAVWTERFGDVGEATLELPIGYYPLALDARNYPNGHYLHFSESTHVMNLVSSKIVVKGSEPRVVLYYKGVENMLSFRRISLGPMAWPYYETNPDPALHKTLMDLLRYEMIDRYPNPYLQIWQDPRVREPSLSVFKLDFSVGDTVLDAMLASCNRNTPFRYRHGFDFITIGNQRQAWQLRILPVETPATLPDFTDYIESLEFGISTTEYANAALVEIPKIEERKSPGSPVYDAFNVVGTRVFRSPTYNEGNVHSWNRVEKYLKYNLDGMTYKEAMATLSYLEDAWGQMGSPNDSGQAKKIIQSQSRIQTVATTPATFSDDLVYGRDYKLGTLFRWTPYLGSGKVRSGWFGLQTEFEALVSEFTWTFDQNGVKKTPGIKM